MSGLSRLPVQLYRAMVYSPLHKIDMAVFFEAPRSQRMAVLEQLLNLAWKVDPSTDVSIENLISEHELLDSWAMGDISTGDLRLFEIGIGAHGLTYLRPAQVQYFVNPLTLLRLQQALSQLPTPAKVTA